MSTKSMPGPFNCYAAALPDEPVFTILGRDPAFPATVAFWRDQRENMGKNQTEDDIGRLAAIANEISKAVEWRRQNLNPMGDGMPTWRLPRQFETDEKPIRVEDPTTVACGENQLVRIGCTNMKIKDIEKALEEAEDAMRQPAPQMEVITQGFVRVGDKAVSVDEIERRLAVGDKIAVGLRQVGEDIQGMANKLSSQVHKHLLEEFVDRINGYAAEMGAYIPGRPVKGNRALGMGYKVPVVGMEFMGDEEDLTLGERVQIDSAPEDLAHAPEVPQHRFSQFNKGVHFAYARGLEINPSHLPVALDAMMLDGWECICSFGKTDSQHIGFLFKRVVPEAVTINMKTDYIDPEKFARAFGSSGTWEIGRRISDEPDRYRKGDIDDKVIKTAERLGLKFPKIEVHLEGMSETDALRLMSIIECRMQWLPQDYEKIRVVGLIGGNPETAFDFEQHRGRVEKRKTLIKGNCGDMEFGRQQEP